MEQKDSRQKATRKRVWPKRLLAAAVVGSCLLIVGYITFRIWKWASVPHDAPVIGVSLDTAWHARMGITTTGYEVGLTRAGGRILELRPGDASPEDILGQIDALLLAGGGDVDPALYGGEMAGAQLVDPERDRFELALIQGALEREIPVLGICRGIQILNVSQGGTVRNLRDDADLAHTHGIEVDSLDAHPVTIAAGSKLATLLSEGRRDVNSFHGRALGQLGPGVVAAAEAPDGVVEAIELSGPKFAIGLQWHPEMPPQQMPVFEAFLKEAKVFRQRRGR